MGDVVLYIAVSLDGYIADQNGGVDWLSNLDNKCEKDRGYENFLESVDTVIMGYNTYLQIATELSPGQWPYPQQISYVFTHRKLADTENIRFTNQPVSQWFRSHKARMEKNIWICGGAQIVKQCMDDGLIDRFHLTVIPTILGNGIPLFPAGTLPAQLKLIFLKTVNGNVECIYRKQSDTN